MHMYMSGPLTCILLTDFVDEHGVVYREERGVGDTNGVEDLRNKAGFPVQLTAVLLQ